jgi:DNA transposition AAA+ family ATPase
MAQLADDTAKVKLDDPTLEQRCQHYPPELREPFMWLGAFVRNECSREFDILTERARKIGVHMDKTVWSRILRGNWNRTPTGEPTTNPLVKLPKLLNAIEALRKDSRFREQGGGVTFIPTTTSQRIFDFIDAKRAPDRICKFGIIVGETGSGKTASTREYQRQNNHGAVTWNDAPETPSLFKFKTDLAARYGCHPECAIVKKESTIRKSVNERRTIILENIQRLYDPRLEGRQPIFDYLSKLQEETGCTVILTFTPTFRKVFSESRAKGFFEQFEGRAGGAKSFLTLPEYPPEEDVAAIAEAFGMRDVDKHIDYLQSLAQLPGRIRILFDSLQSAKILAVHRKTALTISHVREVREED